MWGPTGERDQSSQSVLGRAERSMPVRAEGPLLLALSCPSVAASEVVATLFGLLGLRPLGMLGDGELYWHPGGSRS